MKICCKRSPKKGKNRIKISSHDLAWPENIDFLNEILKHRNIKIEMDTDFDEIYSHYVILKDNKNVFETIYPKELLIKIAQLIPESEVRLGRYEVYVGPDNVDMSQETLVIEI